MRKAIGILVTVACVLPAAARANTRFGFGTIVDVDTDGRGDRKGTTVGMAE